MSGFLLFSVSPLFVWMWRKELINLVSDMIAEGIRKSKQ